MGVEMDGGREPGALGGHGGNREDYAGTGLAVRVHCRKERTGVLGNETVLHMVEGAYMKPELHGEAHFHKRVEGGHQLGNQDSWPPGSWDIGDIGGIGGIPGATANGGNRAAMRTLLQLVVNRLAAPGGNESEEVVVLRWDDGDVQRETRIHLNQDKETGPDLGAAEYALGAGNDPGESSENVDFAGHRSHRSAVLAEE